MFRVPERFLHHIWWFTNAERVGFIGPRVVTPSQAPSLWRLPQSVTSLILDTNVVTLLQVRDIVVHLPNLDNLTLTGALIPVGKNVL